MDRVTVLPLFPLQLVLFPSTPQLLHIFEPRYRRMLADCQHGDGRFGLSRLQPDQSSPLPGDIGCSAVISQHQPLPDGRSNILAIGERRFVLQELLSTDSPYYEGRVQYFEDGDQDDSDVAGLAQTVWRAFRALRTTQGQEIPASFDLSYRPVDLSFLVATALDLSLDQKEELARLTSAAERFRRLGGLIADATEAARVEAAMAKRARGNGHGDHPPEFTDSA